MSPAAINLPSGQLYGTRLRSYASSDLKLMETVYAPGAQLPRHSHECASLCLVLQGTYSEVYGRDTRVCRTSTLVFYSPGEEHSDYFLAEGGRCFNAEVSSRWLEHVREYSAVMDSPTEFNSANVVHLATKLYKEFRLMDEAAPLAIEGLMLEILAEASRRSDTSREQRIPRRIGRAREFILGHFHEPIRLERVAQAVDAHPVYLAREFRKYYACTVGEYIRRLRIELVCSKLSRTDEPLSNVALAAGFADQSHLSRSFKIITGMSPAKYRKIYRRG